MCTGGNSARQTADKHQEAEEQDLPGHQQGKRDRESSDENWGLYKLGCSVFLNSQIGPSFGRESNPFLLFTIFHVTLKS